MKLYVTSQNRMYLDNLLLVRLCQHKELRLRTTLGELVSEVKAALRRLQGIKKKKNCSVQAFVQEWVMSKHLLHNHRYTINRRTNQGRWVLSESAHCTSLTGASWGRQPRHQHHPSKVCDVDRNAELFGGWPVSQDNLEGASPPTNVGILPKAKKVESLLEYRNFF